MRNRYPGSCQACTTKVSAGVGVVIKESGRWRTYCAEHEPVPTAPPRGGHSGWHTTTLAGYDCETSSADPREAFLVSAALVDTAGAQRTWLVDPGEREIPADATALHGISTERARSEGIAAAQALEEIAEALREHLAAGQGLVIFNAPFDLGVLDNELHRRDMRPLLPRLAAGVRPIVDPLVLDRGLDPYRRGRRNLGAMCEFYGVTLTDAHTATADAAACLALAREIGARYPEAAGFTLAELHDHQVDWALQRAQSRQRWLDRTKPGHNEPIGGAWPGNMV